MTNEPKTPFAAHLRMPPTPTLQTRRLVLRAPRESDTPVVQRRFPQWEIVRYLHAEAPWPYPHDGPAPAEDEPQDRGARKEPSGDHAEGWLRCADRIDLALEDRRGELRDQRGFWLDP